MIEFYQTIMGNQFYQGTMPALVKQLERLNDNLEQLLKVVEEAKPKDDNQPKGDKP